MSHGKDDPHTDDIGCIEALEAFYAYLDSELESPDAIADFEHHMEHCRSCYSRSGIERALTEHIRNSGKSRAPDALRARLRNLIDKF